MRHSTEEVSHARQDGEGARGPLRQVGMKSGSQPTATKGHTVEKRAYIVTLAVLVALMVASGASAQKTTRHSVNNKAERHMLVKRAPDAKTLQGKGAAAKRYRRTGRSSF